MNITIGMFAHVDAGKTTFAEQLLYHTNSIRERGRVDHRDAFLDSHEIERARGITVFADQAVMTYKGNTYHLIDTPGHVDFSPEMERAVAVMDYAILVVSAVEGVQGHTETVWQLLRRRRVPTLLFINKTDRVGADAGRVLEEIRQSLSPDAIDLTGSALEGELDEAAAEQLAERDEELLDRYMAGDLAAEDWLPAVRRLVREGRIFPCLHGSALQDVGVADFLELLDRLAETDYAEEGPFAGRVYKIRHDAGGTRITFVKALSGALRVRDELGYGGGAGRPGDSGAERVTEKATQLRLYNGSAYKAVDRVAAGQLFGVVGLSAAGAGDGVGALSARAAFEVVPTLQSSVIAPPSLPAKELLRLFRLLEAEDPSLNVVWDEHHQDIRIHVMGTIQLEVLEQLVRERFGVAVAFGSPDILYKETIADPVGGCGHFEPLGHYAEVHVRLEPADRDSGVTFRNECHPDVLTTNFQHLVRQHVFEREHPGVLTGAPLTDVTITLLKGRAHNKHTSGGDFREATYRAIRQGLEKAENLLLEPWYAFKIKVEFDQVGRVLSDLAKAGGQFGAPEAAGGKAVIAGRVPVATFLGYSAELASFTQGKGALSLSFGGYERCHNEAEVVARKAYNRNADPAGQSASIFCAKGQAYAVPWDEADRHMHI